MTTYVRCPGCRAWLREGEPCARCTRRASAGLYGLGLTLLALLWLLAGCDGVPTPQIAAITITATPTPVVTPTPPCAGAAWCGRCEWRRNEAGTPVPMLVYTDHAAEPMTAANHAWNIANVCPPAP